MQTRAALAAALGSLAFAGALWLTQPLGPGLTPDAMSYLGSAESFAHGRGLRVPYASWSEADSTAPLRVFPPAFPIAIGATVRLGATPVQGARFVQALAAAAMVAALAWMLDVLAGSVAAVIGCAAAMLTPAIVADHFAALSEPLFLAWVVLALWFMAEAPDRPARYGWVAAAAALTRYAGLALSAACLVWALLQPGRTAERLRRAAVAGLPTLVLFGAWIIRTRIVAGALPARFNRPDFAFGSILAEARHAIATTLAPGLEGTRWQRPAAILALALIVLLLGLHRRNSESREATRPVHRPARIFAACYLALIGFTRVFIGHGIPFDERILSPLMLVGGLLITLALAHGWRRWGVAGRAVAGVLTAVWFTAAALSLSDVARDVRSDGYDFGSLEWKGSPTIAWLKGAQGLELYTNHPVPVYFQLGRPSRDIPASLSPDTLRAFAAVLAAHPAALVAFYDTTWEPDAWAAALASRLNLHEVARLRDGVIWVTRQR